MFSLFSAVLIFLLKFVRFLLKLARKIVFFLPAARTELFSSILPAVPLHLQMVGEAEVHLLSVHYSDTVSLLLYVVCLLLFCRLDDLRDVLSENEKLAHYTKQKDEKILRLQERYSFTVLRSLN